MTRTFASLMLGLMVAGAACSKRGDSAADSTLNTDLSLAAQQRAYSPLDSLTPAERAAAMPNALRGTSTSRTSSASSVSGTRTSAASSPVRRRTSAGSATTAGPTTSTTTTSGGDIVVKHPQRDAAIGAAAGAIIGATTSHNKVKGGVIGAAVGGILGGVIGNNVDKTKKKKP